jgi:hypothetical protein
MKLTDSVKISKYFSHETKRHAFQRFLIVLLLFFGYFMFVSWKYGLENGFLVAILTWTFFVFCTPIADAGLLLDFPVRVLTNIRMLYTEIVVWIIAALVNLYTFTLRPEIYNTTILLKTFKHILTHPFPFWAIILVSATGTFMSVYFADELVDVVRHEEREKYKKHAHKHRLIIFVFIILITIVLYDYLLSQMGVKISV